ncbi:hypothetical protein BKA93DRAFT_204314 [Sparassis latifolia]
MPRSFEPSDCCKSMEIKRVLRRLQCGIPTLFRICVSIPAFTPQCLQVRICSPASLYIVPILYLHQARKSIREYMAQKLAIWGWRVCNFCPIVMNYRHELSGLCRRWNRYEAGARNCDAVEASLIPKRNVLALCRLDNGFQSHRSATAVLLCMMRYMWHAPPSCCMSTDMFFELSVRWHQ